MTASGMPADHKGTAEPREFTARHSHLPDDILHGDVWTKPIVRDCDTDPTGVEAGSEMAEIRAVQRLPVTAMNKHDDGRFMICRKEVYGVSWLRAVAESAFAVPIAVGRRVPFPAGDNG